MAKIQLKKSEFSNIPEGEQIIRVKSIDDSAFADFDKLTLVIEDKDGNTLKNNFEFTDKDGQPNDKAMTVFTIAARMLLGDQTLDEIDYNDLLGKYATVEIVHATGTKGGTFANIKKWIGTAEGFAGGEAPRKRTAAEILAAARAKRA